jgi:hypothetical protein
MASETLASANPDDDTTGLLVRLHLETQHQYNQRAGY